MSLRGLVAPAAATAGRWRASWRGWLLVAGLLLLALNMRPALTTVPPVLGQIQADFGLSSGVAGLLTTIPVFCFALLSPVAALLARRFGIRNVLTGFLVLVLTGSLLRGISELSLLIGTVLIGAGIALANVLLPAVVKQDFPYRAGLMTGLYLMFMGLGASLAAAATVPIRDATGQGWAVATATWAGLAAIALTCWIPQREAAPVPTVEQVHPHGVRRLARSPLAWQLTLFMGLQSLGYYSVLTWLPSLLVDSGVDATRAGLLLALANLCGIPALLSMPIIANRLHSQSVLAVLVAGIGATALLGLVLAPLAATYLWVLLLGLSQGGAISLALTLIMLRSGSSEQAAELSGLVQAGGYTLAAAGPFVVGFLSDHTGGWTIPLIFLLACLLPQATAGTLAGRPLQVAASTASPEA